MLTVFGESLHVNKNYTAGTHRVCVPEDTFGRIEPMLSRFGITRIANITGLDRIGLPTCVAIRPTAKSLTTSQGKGDTLIAAKVSAAMESIESWHGERVAGPLVYANYRELLRESRAVNPLDLPTRADAKIDIAKPLYWIEGRELTDDSHIWVPFELATNNFVEAVHDRPRFFKSTNGLASGNHLAEAIYHGLLEVIERDALTLWELSSEDVKASTQIDIASIQGGYAQHVIEQIVGAGVAIGIWDITSDVGIPAFTCQLVENPDSKWWRPVASVSGHGCHIEADIAITRAINEALQSRATLISGSRDDMFPRDYQVNSDPADHSRVIKAWSVNNQKRSYLDVSTERQLTSSKNFKDDISLVLKRLSVCGVDSVVVVDLRQESVGIPVVKVIIPGLEPVMTGLYQPGRRAQSLLQKGQL